MHPAILGLIGGGIVVLSGDEGAAAPDATQDGGTAPPVKASSLVTRRTFGGGQTGTVSPLLGSRPMTGGTGTGTGLSAEEEAAIKAALQDELNRMTDEEIQAACKRLKQQYPDNASVQAMPCTRNLEVILRAVGASVGAAIGGSIGGPLGAVAGAYIGDKVGGWVADQLESYWSGPSDHTTETLDLSTPAARAEACKATDSTGRARIRALLKERGISPPQECLVG